MSIASGQYIIECFYLSQIYETPSNISYHREKSINFNDISSASRCSIWPKSTNCKNQLLNTTNCFSSYGDFMAQCEFFKVCQLHRNHKGNGNVPMVIFSLLSRFKLCFVETQVFLTISCNKISSLFKTRISVNESNFPDLLLARILKTRLISLIAFSIFTILLCLKSFDRKVLSITPHRKRIKEIGSFMNVVPICRLYFSLKKNQALFWRSPPFPT